MKFLAFLIGMAWLLYGAMFFDYPDWDIGVSLLMGCSTYLVAGWCWKSIKEPVKWPLIAMLAWLCVDGSYWLYWSLVDPSVMIREGQWLMSLCLFLLAGFVFATAEDLQEYLCNLQSVVQVKQEWRFHRQRPFFERVTLVKDSLQRNREVQRLLKKVQR